MSPSLRSPLLALAGAAALSLSAPAQAAIYTGTFDPAFGGNFSGLGWRGGVTFEVADACVALGTANSFDNAECQSAVTVLSAIVELYEDPADTQTPDVLNLSSLFSIFGVDLVAGEVVSVDGSMFIGNWVAPAGSLVAPVVTGYANYRYGLEMGNGEAILRAYSTNVSNNVDQLFGNCPWDGDYAICNSATNPKVTFTRVPTQVPEPGSLLLAGAALAAAAAVRRRRR